MPTRAQLRVPPTAGSWDEQLAPKLSKEKTARMAMIFFIIAIPPENKGIK
jgi:hypothetical protein